MKINKRTICIILGCDSCETHLRNEEEIEGNWCALHLFGYTENYDQHSVNEWNQKPENINWPEDLYVDINIVLNEISNKIVRDKFLMKYIDMKLSGGDEK